MNKIRSSENYKYRLFLSFLNRSKHHVARCVLPAALRRSALLAVRQGLQRCHFTLSTQHWPIAKPIRRQLRSKRTCCDNSGDNSSDESLPFERPVVREFWKYSAEQLQPVRIVRRVHRSSLPRRFRARDISVTGLQEHRVFVKRKNWIFKRSFFFSLIDALISSEMVAYRQDRVPNWIFHVLRHVDRSDDRFLVAQVWFLSFLRFFLIHQSIPF